VRPVGQQTLAMQTGFERHARKCRREQFLEEMEWIVPWTKLTGLIQLDIENGA
jgi:IS5 family transposase